MMIYLLIHIFTKLVASWVNECYFDELRLFSMVLGFLFNSLVIMK